MSPQSPHQNVRTGRILGGTYRVNSVLGTGASSVVMDAEKVATRERCIIKVYDPALLAQQRDGVAGFLREANLLVRVGGAHTMSVKSVGRLETGAPFLVMEYLVGVDLRRYLAEAKAMWITEATEFMIQACDSLGRAHALGLVHRAVRPGNLVLIDNPGGKQTLKVANYSVGNIVDGPTASGLADVSMIEYAAPELLSGSGPVDARADVWSIGVTLYELVTGKRPFSSAQISKMIEARTYELPPPALSPFGAKVPEALTRVLHKCLDLSPSGRYANAEELGDALRPVTRATAIGRTEKMGALTESSAATLILKSGEHPEVSPPSSARRTLPRPAFSEQKVDDDMPDSATATIVRQSLSLPPSGSTAMVRLPSFVVEELPSHRGRNFFLGALALILIVGLPLFYIRDRALRAEAALPAPSQDVIQVRPSASVVDVTPQIQHTRPPTATGSDSSPTPQRFFALPSGKPPVAPHRAP